MTEKNQIGLIIKRRRFQADDREGQSNLEKLHGKVMDSLGILHGEGL
jgi:hypothetical protein